MKTLIVYYSRTGNTRKIAKRIAEKTKGEIEDIIDTVKRSGILGYLKSGRDATLRKLTCIKPLNHNIKEFDLVVIGTPIWSWNMSVPVRAFLDQYKADLKKVAFFCTMAGSGSERAFAEMEAVCGKKPVATVAFSTGELVNTGLVDRKLNKFTASL